jgi:hypothetical protein
MTVKNVRKPRSEGSLPLSLGRGVRGEGEYSLTLTLSLKGEGGLAGRLHMEAMLFHLRNGGEP